MFKPLNGIKVIDVTQVLAGPYCSYLLGLMGADVIKVENPDGGDWTRNGGGDAELAAAGLGTPFLAQNANKKSLSLNLKDPRAIDILHRLVGDADVFLENFKPGVAEGLGLGEQALRRLNDKLVYASLSAFGHSGPLSDRPAYDHIIQAVSGIMTLTGTAETVPNKVGAPYVDYATGLNGAFAVMAAIMEARRTGEGQVVDVSMLDTTMMLMASHMTNFANTGIAPQPAGLNAFSGSPGSGAYETADGLLLIAANNHRQLLSLLDVIGRGELKSDPRFAEPAAARENAEALKAIFTEAFAAEPALSWEAQLNAARVPAAKLRSFPEAMQSDQLRARELMTEITLPVREAPVTVPSLPFRANGEAVSAVSTPPQLGADTEDVLLGLGYSEADVAALRDDGVV